MSAQEAHIRDVVRRVLHRTLGLSDRPSGRDAPSASASTLITEQAVAGVERGGRISVPPGALVTPLARQIALERNIALVETPSPRRQAIARPATAPERRTVAIGADHGGFALKETLKAFLEEMGYTSVDCGTHSSDPVDYPDYALAVAELVSSGRAWRGIVVDGAGIGSCMAANKVPGVRAAMCYDQATAVNSREHNDANVLTLGAGLIGATLAKQIAKTWLETDFGGGRHARRVDKIAAIEKRFSK
ncbi:MAG TPA: ribose 5-phosphate isomerase B [Anaerolineae bacterium]|nr:ribose 5-phosphate isomerase B [Anaerolineae bacterium]